MGKQSARAKRKAAKNQRRAKRKRQGAAKRSQVGSGGGGTTWTLPAQTPAIGHGLEGKLILDDQGRVTRVEDGQRRILTDAELGALPQNTLLWDSDTFDLEDAVQVQATVLSPPAATSTGSVMRVGVAAPSKTAGDEFWVWHPTFTVRVFWEAGIWDDPGEWALEIRHDVLPDEIESSCALGADGTQATWSSHLDPACAEVERVVDQHREALVQLALRSATRAS